MNSSTKYFRLKEDSLRRKPYRFVFAAFLIVCLPAAVFGQGDHGRIAGIVKDASGALIPGVTVAIKNERTGEERTALTGDTGEYFAAALRPSTYTVQAS